MEAGQTSRRSLGEVLVDQGLVSEADLERALAEEFATKRRLAEILVRRGLVTGRDITNALAQQFTSFRGADAGDNGAHGEPDPVSGHGAEPPGHHAPKPFLWSDAEPESHPEAVAVDDAGDAHPAPVNPPVQRDEAKNPNGMDAELVVEPETLIRETDARRGTMESTLSALGPILESLGRIQADLEAHDLSTPLLSHELAATQERLIARGDALSAEIALLKETRAEIEQRAAVLESLRTELADKIHELAELRATAAIWTSRVDNLEAEVESLSTRANDAAHQLNALAAARVPTPHVDARTETHPGGAPGADARTETHSGGGPGEVAPQEPARPELGHVLFVPTDDGYELLERGGGAPGVGEVVEVGDANWVVAKIGPSPLPYDERPCAFLTTVG